MLVELGVVEQRYAAVREVLEGATVVDVARRNGVARQTVHDWLRKYATGGMAALVDRSSKPARCAHQMAPAVEAAVLLTDMASAIDRADVRVTSAPSSTTASSASSSSTTHAVVPRRLIEARAGREITRAPSGQSVT
ncbi:MAG: helix-turn-helix domain-containing protein [Actinobacteria bacterium]|nr:helix-turn-helix domain-containing protein [Actinomycetota bacterium]